MKTKKQWNESGENFSKFCQPWEEVDEDIYYYFLEVLPPETMGLGGFLVGEPARHNDEGKPMFAGFCRAGGMFFYLGELTRDEFYNGPSAAAKLEKMEQIEAAS